MVSLIFVVIPTSYCLLYGVSYPLAFIISVDVLSCDLFVCTVHQFGFMRKSWQLCIKLMY